MQILKSNNQYEILNNIEIINNLPKGSYELKYGAFGRIYLEKQKDVVLPDKIYSNDSAFIDHVNNEWNSNVKQLGVGLIGGKGLGKSFTGNVICKKIDVPVIRILDNPNGLDIFSFLNSIEQDHIIYIDEFEKIFPMKNNTNVSSNTTTQEKFLSFLDDGGKVLENKRMLIITSNSDSMINEFLKNRPSRLRYINYYNSLPDIVLKEIVDDLLIDKSFIQDLIDHLPYNGLNIDVLIQIINEINYHNKPYSSFKKFFNFEEVGHRDSYSLFSKEGTLINPKVTSIYYNDDAGKLNNRMLYFKDTLSLKGETQDVTLYYENDDDKSINVEATLVLNQRINPLINII